MALNAPHRRYNPLLEEWVLCSPQRLERPWQGGIERIAAERPPAYDPACYLCPGNARAGAARNPPYGATFAFDNDFPALGRHSPESAGANTVDEGLLIARPESGVCRVLCFSPRHDLTLAEMEVRDIRAVVDAWAEEVRALRARDDVDYVQVFENKGELMGCSNPHPHGQIWATAGVPTRPARLLVSQRRHHQHQRRDLVGDYLDQELRAGERLVCANEDWVVLVPFWAVWPFETMVVPRRRVPDLASLSGGEADALADVLKRLLVRYDNLFSCSFPYTMGWQGCPSDDEEHPEWRLFASFFPPLLRSATVRKFLVGYELAAEPQRDFTPEDAAERLRASPESATGAA